MNNENKEANEQSAKNSTSLDGQRLAKLEAINSELLTALEKALASLEGQAELLRHCGAAYGIGATLAQARAAIAKATEGGAL